MRSATTTPATTQACSTIRPSAGRTTTRSRPSTRTRSAVRSPRTATRAASSSGGLTASPSRTTTSTTTGDPAPGTTRERQHHHRRQHDHRQRRPGHRRGDLVQLLDHRQLHGGQRHRRRAGQRRNSPARPSTSARAAVTRRSAPCRPARKRRARSGHLPRPVGHRQQHPGGQRRQHFPLAELQPVLLGLEEACARWSTAGHAGPFTMQSCAANLPSATISTSAFAGKQDRLARRGLVGRLPVGDRQRQRHRQRDRLQPG